MSTSAISIWLPRIRLLIAVMVGICFVVALVAALGQLRDHPIDFSKLKWSRFGVAVLLYIAALSAGGVYWHYVLGVMGQRIDFLSALRIFYISQLGKYVPGKAMVVLIRATELQRRGVPFKIAVTSVFVETLTWIAVGAVCGALAIVCWVPDHVWLVGLASCVAVVAVVPNLPPVLRILLKWMKFEPHSIDRFRAMDVVYGWGVFAVGWSLSGLSLWVLVSAFPFAGLDGSVLLGSNGEVVPAIQAGDFLICLAAVALASVLGFVSLLPGGIGVRELVMLPLLGARFGFAEAAVVVVVLRLIWMASELLLAVTMRGLHRGRMPCPAVDAQVSLSSVQGVSEKKNSP